jgi:hypothetical protein
MLKNFFLAAVCVAGFSAVGPITATYADATGTVMTSAEQTVLDTQVAAVEALVEQYQSDPDGLLTAIEDLVVNASDPETTGNAVLMVFDNSQNLAIRVLFANNANLADAGGKGLGAAVAQLGVTNPDLAVRMVANVAVKGSPSFVASVKSGDDTRTASIRQSSNNSNSSNSSARNYNSTPEKSASAS